MTLHYNTRQRQRQLQLHYATLHYTTLITPHYTTPHQTRLDLSTLQHATLQHTTLQYITLHYTHYTTPQLQLQLRHTNCTTHCTTATATAALQHATSSSCGWGDRCNHCNHSKKHNSNHLSVHQWIRSAIHASQQLTSPIVSYLWNFRRLVQYYS